jgi:prolyl-tRNA editing enzyme YbaK/EbsC (Cys-tRNA(Pro) deacylase)
VSTHPNVQRVADALAAAGATGEIRILDEAVPTAAAAAAELGCEVGAIANSLIFDGDGSPVLILTSGAHRVDTAKLAAELGLTKLKRATPDFVKQHTGQSIGGVAPVGHPAPVRTLVDTALDQYAVVWAAGGIPHSVFPTSYDELLHLTNGTPVVVN